ncbi:MAG: hypothetical protein AABY40_02895 [Nanoarchaeota archaeon]
MEKIDIYVIISWTNLAIGSLMLLLILLSISKIKESKLLLSVSAALLLSIVLFLMHAVVEVMEYGREYYAITALMATIVLSYLIIFLKINSPIPVRKGDKK